MTLAIRPFFLFAGIVLSFAAALAAPDNRPHLSSDLRVNGAREMIESGRFEEALHVLRPLAPDHLDRTDILFLIGLAAIEASRHPETGRRERTALLDEAVSALHTILVGRPGLVRVRLELARAFFLKRDDNLAREHFERVLAGRPPPAVAANIHRFLEAMRARRRWSGYFGFSVAPDTNFNTASDAEIIYISGLPFRRDSSARSGVGAQFWGGGEYQRPLGSRFRLRAGADVARREYDGKEFDQTFLSAHAGPRWLAGANTELSLLGSFRRRWIADDLYSSELGFRLESERRFSRRLTGWARMSWHQREHPQRDGLDGPHAAFSLAGAWLITPTVRADAATGYRREHPESMVWRNRSRWARLGASVALPLGFTLGADGEMRRTKYRGNWFPFTQDGESREDRTLILRASAFNRAFTVYGLSPKLVLVAEERESNAQLYDYKRKRAELRFVRQF